MVTSSPTSIAAPLSSAITNESSRCSTARFVADPAPSTAPTINSGLSIGMSSRGEYPFGLKAHAAVAPGCAPEPGSSGRPGLDLSGCAGCWSLGAASSFESIRKSGIRARPVGQSPRRESCRSRAASLVVARREFRPADPISPDLASRGIRAAPAIAFAALIAALVP